MPCRFLRALTLIATTHYRNSNTVTGTIQLSRREATVKNRQQRYFSIFLLDEPVWKDCGINTVWVQAEEDSGCKSCSKTSHGVQHLGFFLHYNIHLKN